MRPLTAPPYRWSEVIWAVYRGACSMSSFSAEAVELRVSRYAPVLRSEGTGRL